MSMEMMAIRVLLRRRLLLPFSPANAFLPKYLPKFVFVIFCSHTAPDVSKLWRGAGSCAPSSSVLCLLLMPKNVVLQVWAGPAGRDECAERVRARSGCDSKFRSRLPRSAASDRTAV